MSDSDLLQRAREMCEDGRDVLATHGPLRDYCYEIRNVVRDLAAALRESRELVNDLSDACDPIIYEKDWCREPTVTNRFLAMVNLLPGTKFTTLEELDGPGEVDPDTRATRAEAECERLRAALQRTREQVCDCHDKLPDVRARLARAREALAAALESCEQNVEDPDTVTINILRAALAEIGEGS